jgi:threonine/homoserine/homoserine lactone efflux protein
VASLPGLVVATAVLVMIPGANVALIVASSLRFGIAAGLRTVLGTTAGVALQLSVVVAGLAAVMQFAAQVLGWIRWAGVVYLVWLGIRAWNEPRAEQGEVTPHPAMFRRGVLIAAADPKTLLFHSAFLPQFVHVDGSVAGQPAIVAAVYIGVLLAGDTLWALGAASARRVLASATRWRSRLTGGALIAAGVTLALSQQRN